MILFVNDPQLVKRQNDSLVHSLQSQKVYDFGHYLNWSGSESRQYNDPSNYFQGPLIKYVVTGF